MVAPLVAAATGMLTACAAFALAGLGWLMLTRGLWD